MTTHTDVPPRRTAKRSTIPALALLAIAVAALAGGCIQSHDPRNDSSRLDASPRNVPAISQPVEAI
jgi:hypothetical protein